MNTPHLEALAARFQDRRSAAPRLYSPAIGRTQRSYSSRAEVLDYESGWREPAHHTPSACGTPAQQGALDRQMFDRDCAREGMACALPA